MKKIMEQPLVSVLMTAYNREAYIAEAIESVLSSIYENFELIIVDDCSKDNTVSIARDYEQKDARVKVFINEHNLGDYQNRNKAASLGQGKYIKYIDSDDVMYPHCLSVMVYAMEQFPEAGFALSAMHDAAKPYPVLLSPREIYLEHYNGYTHFHRAPGSALIKKEVFDDIGGFSGERMIGDVDMWYKMSMYYPMVKTVNDLYWDRQHNSQERNSAYAKNEYPRLMKMVSDRYASHVDCPLTKEEILALERKNRLNSRLKNTALWLKRFLVR